MSVRISSLKIHDFKERMVFADGKGSWNVTTRGYLKVGFFGNQENNVWCTEGNVIGRECCWSMFGKVISPTTNEM